ncbi:hypothetical protein glysoja_044258 [Glycine soja]|uniref:Uncharacterized protein n=1 Tax=Glycine soja TaxID=3848 RepID=A0A0B2S5C1_GLYSO|nr:hypothetical protein glysoja_044258 [Glycine soja]
MAQDLPLVLGLTNYFYDPASQPHSPSHLPFLHTHFPPKSPFSSSSGFPKSATTEFRLQGAARSHEGATVRRAAAPRCCDSEAFCVDVVVGAK